MLDLIGNILVGAGLAAFLAVFVPYCYGQHQADYEARTKR